ncbi:hypothetical protein McanMca71_004341 [Microsporum canis]
MDWDHLAEEKAQTLFAGWLRLLFRDSTLPLRLAQNHRPDVRAVEASEYTTGSCNICTTVTFEDGQRVVDELATMTFLAVHSAVPVPKLLGQGRWAGGPYIVMSFVEGKLLSSYLRDPTVKSPSLKPDVDEGQLRQAYASMAKVLLDLSKPVLSSIGGLVFDCDRKGWKVDKRPLTLNMNELVRVGNVPLHVFTQSSFPDTPSYFSHLADQQFMHLFYQRNDAVKGYDDCRKKYIARCLFKQVARRLAYTSTASTFHLYCDDLRPSNVLVDSDFSVTAVIDWEYTYFAPAEFTHAAPWWLLFESPEAWESDLTRFLDRYRPRLDLFLSVLRKEEDARIAAGEMRKSQRLSGRMAESMEDGVFWFCLAARKSFMFDDIYWTFLHGMFFDQKTEPEDYLTAEEKDGMQQFIEMKIKQAEEGTLDEHSSFDEVFDM